MGVGEFFAKVLARHSMSNRVAIAVSRQSGIKPFSTGFTLLEVLIVVTIAAIVLALGIPSFQNTILSNRLTATANAFVSTYNNARLTAIQRNAAVQFCGGSGTNGSSDDLGVKCAADAVGAAYMLNTASTGVLVASAPSLPPGLTLATSPQPVALRFNGQGLARSVGSSGPYTGLLLDLSTSRFTTNNRRCIYIATGSIMSVCSASGTGACNATEPTSCQ